MSQGDDMSYKQPPSALRRRHLIPFGRIGRRLVVLLQRPHALAIHEQEDVDELGGHGL